MAYMAPVPHKALRHRTIRLYMDNIRNQADFRDLCSQAVCMGEQQVKLATSLVEIRVLFRATINPFEAID
jgi:hypothetical protein